MSESGEKRIREKDARIAELEEEVQSAVADRDAIVEEADQAILVKDPLISRCDPLHVIVLQLEAKADTNIAPITEPLASVTGKPEVNVLPAKPLTAILEGSSSTILVTYVQVSKPSPAGKQVKTRPEGPIGRSSQPIVQVEMEKAREKHTGWDSTTWHPSSHLQDLSKGLDHLIAIEVRGVRIQGVVGTHLLKGRNVRSAPILRIMAVISILHNADFARSIDKFIWVPPSLVVE